MGDKKKLIVLAAGGTAGHINAAIALEKKFLDNNFEVLFFSGKRPLDYKLFAGKKIIYLDGRPIKYKNPIKIVWSLYKNILAFIKVLTTIYKLKPTLAIGAGGYICGPVLMAHYLLRIPFFIIEQNAVLGVTNKILLLFADKIFIHLKHTIGISKFFDKKIIVSGNPIRSEFLTTDFFKKDAKRKNDNNNEFAVIVFGGSLGAKSINDLIEDFISSLLKNYDLNFKLKIKHQTGKKVQEKRAAQTLIPSTINNENFTYEQTEYLDNICEEYCNHDFIICRAGASTISELRFVRKPVMLFPYPHHKDRHQFMNAESLKTESLFAVYILDENDKENDLSINNFSALKEIFKIQFNIKFNIQSEKLPKQQVAKNLSLNMKDATEIIYSSLINYL
ncbi:MAG: UDP-N-acetylglucosamine--N-acetylmuramyl-(pentapeptide) pyrophosphoryl-undecaprenol N-acetylglucosamine transferase [Oligoflexia bacterium]|nr:UDP-N-acetylglucosamine--N-acetylmuramyl-(pentapeptide) pyrophosphoryl-undecaprenol N-acetylglucosamine transferase [Oligoflexia bacterium]